MKKSGSDTRFFTGELIGDRLLLRLLRVNGRGEVWYGFNRRTGQTAVFKMIRAGEHRLARLRAVADFLKQTACPQLIKVRDFTEIDGGMLVEMEYASRGTLRAARRRMKRFSPGQAVFVMREVLTALDELHRHGIVHRDIKAGNVWLTGGLEIRLGDFGIAKVSGFPESSPAVFGTPGCLSPEQAEDSTKVDRRSDLFSLSSMIFELLTGRPRFPGDSLTETAKAILCSEPERMADELLPFAPGDLTGLLCAMAAVRPGDRPDSAGEVIRTLDRMGLPGEALSDGEAPE